MSAYVNYIPFMILGGQLLTDDFEINGIQDVLERVISYIIILLIFRFIFMMYGV